MSPNLRDADWQRAMSGQGGPPSFKVLQLIPDLLVGGAERLVVDLARALRSTVDARVLVLGERSGTELESELERAGVPLAFLGKKRGYHPRMTLAVTAAVRLFRPHIVHSHRTVLRYVSPHHWIQRGLSIVHTMHSVAEHESDLPGKALQFVAFRCGVAPVAISSSVEQSMRRLYRLSPAATIPNGVVLDRFLSPRLSRSEWRRRERIPEGAFLLAAVARLSPPKGLDAAIEMMADGRLRATSLVIAGDGELRDDLVSQAARLHLEDRVRFLGRRDDVPEILGACDALLMTSRFEGHPIAAMEALAAGAPVVGFAVGGIPEIVEHDRTGWLVRPGAVEELAGGIAALAADPARRARMRGAARAASGRHGIQATAAQYERLYRTLARLDAGRQERPRGDAP